MGNGFGNPKPQPMQLSIEEDLCSNGLWDEWVNNESTTRSDEIKNRLKDPNNRALVNMKNFCNNVTLISDVSSSSEFSDIKGTGSFGIKRRNFIAIEGSDENLINKANIVWENLWSTKELKVDIKKIGKYGDYYVDKDTYDSVNYISKGSNLNTTVCTGIGDPVEWWPYELTDTCEYATCKPGYAVWGCNGCCAIVGRKQSCARIAFKAEPVVCCFKDMDCDGDKTKCFQTPARQRTCAPEYRNLASKPCRDTIVDYCTGDKLFPTQTDWTEMWLENSEVEINSKMKTDPTVYNQGWFFRKQVKVSDRGKEYPFNEKQPCLRAIARNLTDQRICSWDDIQEGSIISGTYNPEGLAWGRKILKRVVERFEEESETGLLESINKKGVNKFGSFYNTLWDICNKVPLLCTTGTPQNAEGILPSLCKNMTAENLANTPNAIPWCACHMPDSEYEPYQDKFNISKECTPICNREGVIPTINTAGERGWCIQNTCILDPSNINITESQFGDNSRITFRQLCPGCGKGNISRNFSYGDYKNESSTFYSIPEPYPTLGPSSSYTNIYGFGYSESNFDDADMIIECLYTTVDFLTRKNINYEDIGEVNDLEIDDEVRELPRITVQFGEVSYGTDEDIILTGVVNAAMDITNPPDNPEDKFVILFSTRSTSSDGKEYYKKLEMIGNDSEVASYAGNEKNPSPENKEMKKPLTLKLNTKFEEDNKEFVSKTKWSSYEGKVDASVCECTMDNFNLSLLNTKFNGSINFTQECGRSKCLDAAGKVVSCADEAAVAGEEPQEVNTLEYIERVTAQEEAAEEYSFAFVILAGIIGFLFLLYFVYILIHKTM